jgi:hypothetical protein
MAVCMARTPAVLEVLEVLRANGCRVEHVREAGTAVAWDGETRVYQAIRQGPRGPWVVRISDSDRIGWRRLDHGERSDGLPASHH